MQMNNILTLFTTTKCVRYPTQNNDTFGLIEMSAYSAPRSTLR
jgi:hypothetical protein